MNRTKIIIIAGIALLFVLVVFLFINASKKSSDKKKPETVSLTADEDTKFSYEDMLATRKENDVSADHYSTYKSEESTDNSYQRESEDVKTIQDLIRENNSKGSSSVSANSTPANTNVVKQPKTEPVYSAKTAEPSKTVIPEATEVKEGTKVKATEEPKPTNRFFRASENKVTGNTVTAVVHGEQTITNKGTLKMRLLEDLYTSDGTLIPKDTYVYGVANINQERIQVNIESVRIGKNIYPLNRQVFDQDGLKGINVPENLKAEIARKSTAQAVQNSEVQTEGRDILSKTANTVAGAAKSILSKDAQEIKVTIKSNYKIYLK
jgi:hypothetical protein